MTPQHCKTRYRTVLAGVRHFKVHDSVLHTCSGSLRAGSSTFTATTGAGTSPALLTSGEEGWRRGNSSRLSLHLKKCKVEGVRVKTNGSSTLTWFLLRALWDIPPKWPHCGQQAWKAIKIRLSGDVFSISFPTPLFYSVVQICTLEASVAKLLLLNVKLKYTCYFLHLRHRRALFSLFLTLEARLTIVSH